MTALITVAVLAGCAAPSAVPSASPSSAASVSALTGVTCDRTAAPIIVGPDGDQIVLGDGPGGMSTWMDDDAGTYLLRQYGDCVWIIGMLPTDAVRGSSFVTSFFGRLGADFRVVGEFADMNGFVIAGYEYGRWVYRIESTAGEVTLVEDRSDGGPPGCGGGSGSCPEPRVLHRVGG